MNWIKFKDQLPNDGQVILQMDIMEIYESDYDKEPIHKQITEPYITRFDSSKDISEAEALDFMDLSSYSFPELWMPLPELPKEYEPLTKDFEEDSDKE